TRYNYWGDDDGDGQGINGVTATGDISVSFTDKDGNTVNRSDTLDICNAPYKVTLSSTEGYLQTRYGVPNTTYFNNSIVTYYINPYNTVARVCYARPNLSHGAIDSFVGPANIWSRDKGFLVQSTSSSSYGHNFPTTGADGLYFDLLIGGVDGSQLTWSVVTNGSSITATVTSVTTNESWIPVADIGKIVARVKLSGPRADSTQIGSSNPSPFTPLLFLPQTFELVGRDSQGNEVRYGFVLKQWFVHRGNKMDTQSNHSSWCSSLGYRLPQIKDLTNAKCGVSRNFSCINGVDGATPSSSVNHYMRHIGAGFFTEWGRVGSYADVGFVDSRYWTSDAAGSYGFNVESDYGNVSNHSARNYRYGLCTAP
ncbi:hypothetical protein, partial [Gilliamella sp. Pas-s95]|uniref:hypothetical protein n=1 Tax=Gilliamella sp. Pas-s95 TaxID=2687317 RepID=UPI0013208E3C